MVFDLSFIIGIIYIKKKTMGKLLLLRIICTIFTKNSKKTKKVKKVTSFQLEGNHSGLQEEIYE